MKKCHLLGRAVYMQGVCIFFLKKIKIGDDRSIVLYSNHLFDDKGEATSLKLGRPFCYAKVSERSSAN